MPSLRSSTTAALRQRIVSGENGSMNGIPFAFRSGLPSPQDAVVPRRRLDREAGGFEPADELAYVLSHPLCVVSLVARCRAPGRHPSYWRCSQSRVASSSIRSSRV
jgi:hypothetical protein